LKEYLSTKERGRKKPLIKKTWRPAEGISTTLSRTAAWGKGGKVARVQERGGGTRGGETQKRRRHPGPRNGKRGRLLENQPTEKRRTIKFREREGQHCEAVRRRKVQRGNLSLRRL